MSTSNEFEFGVLTATSEHNLLEASMSDGGLLLEMRCRSTMFGYHRCVCDTSWEDVRADL